MASADADGGILPIVIDNGSGMMKAGFGGDDAPRAVFPTIVGRPRQQTIMVGMGQKDCYVGDFRTKWMRTLYPVKYGMITNWDDMERVWHHTFYNELRVDPSEHPVLMSEAAFLPRPTREKLMQVMFEAFHVPQYYTAASAVLALHATGRETGLVLDSGDQLTTAVPVYCGYTVRHATQSIKFGAKALTSHAVAMFEAEYGLSFGTSELEAIRNLKDNASYTYVAADYDLECKKHRDGKIEAKRYDDPTLSYSSPLALTDVRFRMLEPIFQFNHLAEGSMPLPDPTSDDITVYRDALTRVLNQLVTGGVTPLIGMIISYAPLPVLQLPCGVQQMAHDSIQSVADDEMRSTMSANVVLAGANTCFEGFAERLTSELTRRIPVPVPAVDAGAGATGKRIVRVIAVPERKYLVWVGGSMLSSSGLMQQHDMWITRAEYDECGASIVHRKCLA